MSRSRKKTPKLPFSSSVSEKDDKRQAARKARRNTKVALAVSSEADTATEHKRSGTWTFAKDGKRWVKKPAARSMRK